MITTNNLKEFFESLTKNDVKNIEKSTGDYLALYWSVFNVGVYPNAIPITPENEEEETENAENTGGIVCDKDEFFRLYIESKAKNKFIDKLL